MKSKKLFIFAVRNIKWDKEGNPVRCLRNDILLTLMNLSGIKSVDEVIN